MKTLLAATAIAAVFALAGPVSAQNYQPMQPAPMQQPTYTSATPPWMQDDGSSSDHPIHNSDDVSGDRLNHQYRDGLTVPPGQGFPAMGNQR